ncbi:MAG: hypothetical protein U0103_11590 [Candidatus Obscuribacterales bacterium]
MHVHLEALDYIDHACLDLLMNLDKQMKLSGGSLVIDWSTAAPYFVTGVKPTGKEALRNSELPLKLTIPIFRRLKPTRHRIKSAPPTLRVKALKRMRLQIKS